MRKEIPTVAKIIQDAGGAKVIAARLGGKPTEWAVYKWAASGVPDRYWPLLIELTNVTADDLFFANEQARVVARSIKRSAA